MANVSTSNYIYRMGTAPNTRTAVSQKSKIFGYTVGVGGFQQIGAISEFSFDESRTIDPVRGIGYGDMIAELVPSVTDPLTLTLNKTLVYTANLFQVLGYKGGIDGLVRSLRHHRWPFDIKNELVFSELSSLQDSNGASIQATVTTGPTSKDNPIVTPRAVLTFYEGCWMSSYSASFTSDSAMIAENSSVTVTDVIDGVSQYGEFVDTGLAPISSNGGPGKGYSLRFANNSNTVVPI
jgi:hypothetical protein